MARPFTMTDLTGYANYPAKTAYARKIEAADRIYKGEDPESVINVALANAERERLRVEQARKEAAEADEYLNSVTGGYIDKSLIKQNQDAVTDVADNGGQVYWSNGKTYTTGGKDGKDDGKKEEETKEPDTVVPSSGNVDTESGVDDNGNKTGLQESALAYLESLKSNYEKSSSNLEKAYDEFLNREAFSYNANDDLLYQQALGNAVNKGRLAMEDTMGQAAALTGGYGSSYAQNVGNQAYNAYLSDVMSKAPDYYAAAYDRYAKEGNDMLTKINALQNKTSNDAEAYNDYINSLSSAEGGNGVLYNGDTGKTYGYTDSKKIEDDIVAAYEKSGADGVEKAMNQINGLTGDEALTAIEKSYPLEAKNFTVVKRKSGIFGGDWKRNGIDDKTQISYTDEYGNEQTSTIGELFQAGKISESLAKALSNVNAGETYNAFSKYLG